MASVAVKSALGNIGSVVFANNTEDSQKSYDSWSKNYDDDLEVLGNSYALETAKMVIKHEKNPKYLLDIGVGTGKVIEYLRNDGYTCVVDVLDANMGMLVEASKKDIDLRTVIRHFVSENGVLPLKDELYDVVTSAGSFIPNHIPSSALKGILNVLKKNGLFIFTTRSKSTESYKAQLDVVLQELLDAGKVELVDSKEFIHFHRANTDTTSMVYVLKKL